MNRVLSLLVVYIFLQTQSWALSGGPVYGGSSTLSVSGTYAGVIIPDLVEADGVDTSASFGSNSLGLFSLGVPATDLAQGAVVLFLDGSFYQGGLVGVADPGEAKLFALGQLIRVVSKSVTNGAGDTGSISIGYDAKADGTIECDIEQENQFVTRISGSGTFALKVIDLVTFEFVPQGEILVEIEGFKQSTDVSIPDPTSTAGLLNQ